MFSFSCLVRVSGVNRWSGTLPAEPPKPGSISAQNSVEGLDEAGRDRAASTSTTVTGINAADNTVIDNDSYSVRDNHALDTLITSSHAKRRATYADYDQPYEEYVLEGEDADCEEEMAYLLAKVSFNSTFLIFNVFSDASKYANVSVNKANVKFLNDFF